ncbi:MAG: LOG family protein [Deltaproteobacteria bacterium]|nr:LOG family protein [Deltaproteobacteria bacterium]
MTPAVFDKRGRKAVAVYCSARKAGNEARELGRLLAGRGYTILCGGGPGSMQSLAEGTHEGGGRIVAVTIRDYAHERRSHFSETVELPDLASRLQFFIHEADAFVALAGGTGTLAELALTWEFVNKGLVAPKPIIITGPFWNPLVSMLHLEPGAPDPTGLATAAAQHIHKARNPLEVVTVLDVRIGGPHLNDRQVPATSQPGTN